MSCGSKGWLHMSLSMSLTYCGLLFLHAWIGAHSGIFFWRVVVLVIRS